MCSVDRGIFQKVLNIKTRPDAGNGLWIGFLLPLALLINALRHPVGKDYQALTFLSWMILVQQLVIVFRHSFQTLGKSLSALTGFITSLIACLVIGQRPTIGIASGLLVTFVAEWVFCGLLHNLPKSFTVGEAAVVGQGLTLFLFNTFILDFPRSLLLGEDVLGERSSVQDGARNIVELGVLLIFILIGFMNAFKARIQSLFLFVPLLGLIVLAITTVPVSQPIPIQFIVELIFTDLANVLILLMFAALLGVTGLICQWQIARQQPVSTSIRKLFHIVIVVVFLSGLLYQRIILYLGSGVIFAIFLLLEAIRIGKIAPLAGILEVAVKAFVDDRDCGFVALTPIYLLIGCAAPLYLSPIALTGHREALLPLLSGVLSVGIGDMFASVVGSNCGRHKWPGTSKSIEGTVANVVSQILAIGVLMGIGFLPTWNDASAYMICLGGVLANALIEAKTDQVDNLVVPLVSFVIFSLV